MQSVHVYAVQTHFSLFVFFLKKGSLKSPTWAYLGTILHLKCILCVKKEASETASEKKMPLQSQTDIYSQARRLPERQPRVRTVQTRNTCSSRGAVRDCCRKKWTGLEIGVEKLTGLLNRCEKMGCWKLLPVETRVETGSVETMVETNIRCWWSDAPWAKARRTV